MPKITTTGLFGYMKNERKVQEMAQLLEKVTKWGQEELLIDILHLSSQNKKAISQKWQKRNACSDKKTPSLFDEFRLQDQMDYISAY